MDEIQNIIESIAKLLVDKPQSVSVTKRNGERTILLLLEVDKSDIGKIIGKQGVTAAALRTIVKSAGARLQQRYHLDIVD